MSYLVTGAAGFIGFHTCKKLLARGEKVVGIDIVNDYYDPTLKEARLAQFQDEKGFTFLRADLAEQATVDALLAQHSDITHIIHLAAQAGVRYSLINPRAYTRSNIDATLSMLELARYLPKCQHLAYASSSSVYGSNEKLPFAVDDSVDNPISLYAATKKANELMAHTYSHLFGVPTTGLRFFTVYGPWGRPDMAAFLFLKAILAGEPIKVFNNGDMRRDFTYIDDIVAGVLAIADGPPSGTPPYQVHNIGNHRSEELMRFIGLIEQAAGKKAEIDFLPMQPGDVKETYADITPIQEGYGFQPATSIDQGIPRFVEWYRSYYGQ